MELNFTKQILNELKRLIKEQGYSYGEIAVALGMSESGFKKMINSDDCHLGRVESICRVIGIQISDIILSTEQMQILQVTFTSTQESFFMANRTGFLLYWLLVYERQSLSSAQSTLSLDTKKLWTLLRRLDRLNLIKVFSNNRLGLPKPVGVKWVGQTQFVNSVFTTWGRLLLDEVLKRRDLDQSRLHFGIRYLRMSESTWQEFKRDIEMLELKYTNKATSEMRISPQKLRHVRWMTLADQHSWVESELKSPRLVKD